MNLKRINTPKKFLSRILNYPVKQRFLGYFQRPSVEFARDYFKRKPIVACEIGIFRGENSESILKFLNVKEMYLVDPYTRYSEYKRDGYYNKVEKAEKIAKRRLKKYKNKKFIKDYSEKAIGRIPKCDFVYIDGNHTYKYVKKDIEDYSKKLNERGIIAGHDTQDTDVMKAVVEFASKNKNYTLYIESPDWWMIKNNTK